MSAERATGLKGRVILITGAAGGIASVAARRFAAQGARLALLDRDAEALAAVAAALPAPDAHRCWSVDLRDDSALEGVFAEVLAHFGHLDVLLNNAGLLIGGRFEASSPERLRRLVEVNFYVPLRLAQLAVPLMRRQGAGHIINVISSAGLLSVPGFAAYGATKSGLHAFSRTLRRELRGSGVRVTSFCPGSTLSPMTAAMSAAGGAPGGELPHAPEVPAAALLETVLHPRDVVIVSSRPRAQRIAMFLDRAFPRLLDAMWAKRCDEAYYGIAALGGRER